MVQPTKTTLSCNFTFLFNGPSTFYVCWITSWSKTRLGIFAFPCLNSYFGTNLVLDSSMKDFMAFMLLIVTPRATDIYAV